MQLYKNLSGDSGVIAYQIDETSIIVLFRENKTMYEYTYITPGKSDVEKMKELAQKGQGLATYIMTHIKERYTRKWITQ